MKDKFFSALITFRAQFCDTTNTFYFTAPKRPSCKELKISVLQAVPGRLQNAHISISQLKEISEDEYNAEYGFLMAYFEKHSGMSKTQIKKYFKENLTPKEDKIIPTKFDNIVRKSDVMKILSEILDTYKIKVLTLEENLKLKELEPVDGFKKRIPTGKYNLSLEIKAIDEELRSKYKELKNE